MSQLKNIADFLLHLNICNSLCFDHYYPMAVVTSLCLNLQVGLNNIKETDFVNVTIQSLMRITPLRNFFLIPENYRHSKSPLVHRFGELTRKIWHARNFKGQVSPHEFLQAVMKASDKRFQIGVQSDPVEFMSWLLNTMHSKLKSRKRNRSIIHDCFQGELEVVKEFHKKHIVEKKEDGDEQNGDAGSDIVTETSRVPFLMLGLDLPPPPLFKDAMEKNIIPQVCYIPNIYISIFWLKFRSTRFACISDTSMMMFGEVLLMIM
jgi:U4/U6.U5 tri-snRNP-associated protein 2